LIWQSKVLGLPPHRKREREPGSNQLCQHARRTKVSGEENCFSLKVNLITAVKQNAKTAAARRQIK
jgi:hypothetical protein